MYTGMVGDGQMNAHVHHGGGECKGEEMGGGGFSHRRRNEGNRGEDGKEQGMLSCSPLLYLSLFTLRCRLPDDDEAVALFLRGHHQSMQKDGE